MIKAVLGVGISRGVRGGLCKEEAFELSPETERRAGRLWSWQGHNLTGVSGTW